MRIFHEQGLIRKLLVFKDKRAYTKNSDYGRFMTNFTTYSFDYPNKHDDAPDSLSLFVSEIILQRGNPSRPVPINRFMLGIQDVIMKNKVIKIGYKEYEIEKTDEIFEREFGECYG